MTLMSQIYLSILVLMDIWEPTFFFCFSVGSNGKGSACNEGSITLGSTWVWPLGWEDPVEKGTTTQSSVLENSMDRGAWQATVHGVAKSWTQPSDFHFLFFFFCYFKPCCYKHSCIQVFSSTCAEILQGTHQNSSVAVLVHTAVTQQPHHPLLLFYF